jgi:hypothetical protein
MEKYKSLFEFLGRPAGSELGRKVATIAAKDKVMIGNREVNTPSYRGPILLYPESFLNRIFTNKELNVIKNNEVKSPPIPIEFEDDLPF